jgi:hypothetical protein
MTRRPPLPYPLAGSDARAEEPPRAAAQGGGRSSTRLPVLAGLIAGATILALLAAVGWLFVQRSADQARIEALTQQRDQAAVEAEVYRSAMEAADISDIDYRRARSIEMAVASSVIARLLATHDRGGDPLSNRDLVEDFFAREIKTTAWQAIPGQARPGRVLARVDRAASPEVIWISRRSSATADPSVPARTNCLRLEVPALVRSVVAGRSFDSPNSTPALARWYDAFSFVPASFCGGVSAE